MKTVSCKPRDVWGSFKFFILVIVTTDTDLRTLAGGQELNMAKLLIRPKSSLHCWTARGAVTIPRVKICDRKLDCADGRDERNCTRHPGAGRPHPSEIAEHWMQASVWSKNGSQPSLNYAPRFSRFSLDKTCKVLLNSTMTVSMQTCLYKVPPKLVIFSTQLVEQAYTWAKSTAGHVPKGAVIVKLNSRFELNFICRIPRAYLIKRRNLRGRLPTSELDESSVLGVVSPSSGTCSLRTKGPILDYEVLISTEEQEGLNSDCGEGTFKCTSRNQCILPYFVCDGESDCEDGSDENISLCRSRNQCLESEFPCSDGKCISIDNVCNMKKSIYFERLCHNGKDSSEETCEQLVKEKKRFRCSEHEEGKPRFIHIRKRCNSENDCNDASDELGCTRYPFLRPLLPHQLETRNWKQGFWLDFQRSFQQFYQVAFVTEKLKPKHRFEKLYFRHAQQMYGIFNLQCHDQKHICTRLTMGNGTWVVARRDTQFESLQRAPEEQTYEWLKNGRGYVPEGAVMAGLTAKFEPVFFCRPRLDLRVAYKESGLGILIPSQRVCNVLTYTVNRTLRLISRMELDYYVMTDSAYIKDCSSRDFHCGDQQCIEDHFVCDGESDCVNGEDEKLSRCQKRNNCTSEQFPCSDGKCIPLSLTCQGYRQKEDDEEMFSKWSPFQEIVPLLCLGGYDQLHSGCPKLDCDNSSEITCSDGHCIPSRYVCNGVHDCKDGGDKSNCDEKQCDPNGFYCGSGKCLNANARCDKYFDCEDGSDENGCGTVMCITEQGDGSKSWDCKKDPSRLDNLQLAKGFWIPYHSFLDDVDSAYRPKHISTAICRILDDEPRSSRLVLGLVRYEQNGGGVVCSADEVLDPRFSDNLTFEVLVLDSPGAFDWGNITTKGFFDIGLEEELEKIYRDGLIIGGLTDEYEVFFICQREPEDEVFPARARLGSCMTTNLEKFVKALFNTRYT